MRENMSVWLVSGVVMALCVAFGWATSGRPRFWETPEPKALDASVDSHDYPAPVQAPSETRTNYAPNGSFEHDDGSGGIAGWWSDNSAAGRTPLAYSGHYAAQIPPAGTGIVHLRCRPLHPEELLGKKVEFGLVALTLPVRGADAPLAVQVSCEVNGKTSKEEALHSGEEQWFPVRKEMEIPAGADPKSLLLTVSVRPTAKDSPRVDDVYLFVK